MRTRVATVRHGIVEVDVINAGVPALKLVQWHCPALGIECHKEGESYVIPLGELDLRHQVLAALNSDRPSLAGDNTDRAQLAKLGGIVEPFPPRSITK